jgi:superfamily II DNA or RNA helicase
MLEFIFKKEFERYSTKLNADYVNGGTEWITKTLTIEEIKNTMNKHNTIEYTLLCEDYLDKYLMDAEKKAHLNEIERQKIIAAEYEEYIKQQFPFELRGYQIEAFKKIQHILSTSKNQILKLYIMCRCGKTILFQKIAFDYYNRFDMIVYICPRLNLIENMISRWLNIFPNANIAELSSSQGKYCISNDELEDICLERKKSILFVCNDSFQRLKPLLNTNMSKMFVFDEAHYLVRAKTDAHPLVLMKQNKGTTLTVFATATPVIGNYITNTKHVFMNDPEYFGCSNDTINYSDIDDAIKNKFMTPASIVVGSYDLDSENQNGLNEYGTRRLKSVTMLWDLLTADLEYKPNKILMYANSIKSVNSIYTLLKSDNRFKNIDIFKMTSKEEFETNTNSLKKFKESRNVSILINCRMVTDGIDILELDTVVFIDPRYNKSDLIQIISRPRSYHKDRSNKLAYILIPQIYNAVNDFNNDGFETVINIIEELHINNDPTVVKYVMENSNKNGPKDYDRDAPSLQIDEKVKAKILELTKERLLKKPLNLPQTILKVLSDNQPRTSNQIWEVIENNRLWTTSGKTPGATCQANCGALFRQGRIGRQKVDKTFMYFNIRISKQHISTRVFCNILLEDGIKCQGDYYESVSGIYDEIYVVDPETHYKDFSWDMLLTNDKNPYETLEELQGAIDRVMLDDETAVFIKKFQNPDQRLLALYLEDRRIRTDALKYFGKEDYGELHKVLQCYRVRRR